MENPSLLITEVENWKEIPSLIYELQTIQEPVQWADLFPDRPSQPIEVELGSGDGTFLMDYASSRPEINVVGLERLMGRVTKTDRKSRRRGLKNLRMVRLEAWYWTRYMVPPGSVSAIHLYFPDPWPKRKHHKRRLVSPGFPEAVEQALTADGRIYLRTDHREYFEQMVEVFGAASGFRRAETPGSILSILTDFERGFLEKGISTCHACYEKIEPQQPD